MISWRVNNPAYFFEQKLVWVLPCSFCSLFSKSLQRNVLFPMIPPFMFIIFCLLFFCFLMFLFLPKYCKYVMVPGVSYGTWNSLSVTLFANKHDYETWLINILLTRSGDKKRLRLSCKRKLVVLKWTNSNLDGAVLNNVLLSNFSDYT